MNEIVDILTNVGAIIQNSHFVGTSGRHFDTYINKDFLYPHTKEVSRVGQMFAEKYKDMNIEVVVGPALGGIILSQWTAHHLSALLGKEVLAVYTEKSVDAGQIFTRGYENFVKDKRVLVVEDIVTTGGSLLKTANAVKNAGGELIATCALVNKNKDLNANTLGVPFDFLSSMDIEIYDAQDCPLCKKNIPVNTNVGHGKKFLASIK